MLLLQDVAGDDRSAGFVAFAGAGAGDLHAVGVDCAGALCRDDTRPFGDVSGDTLKTFEPQHRAERADGRENQDADDDDATEAGAHEKREPAVARSARE